MKFLLLIPSLVMSQDLEENDEDLDLFRNGIFQDGPGGTRKIGKYFPAEALEDEPTGLRCWKCDHKSVAACQAQGSLETCESNEDSCQLEIRTRKSNITKIKTGCKQKKACQRNQANNFFEQSFWYNKDKTQCRPETNRGYTVSVCRQCCWTDNCVNQGSGFWPKMKSESEAKAKNFQKF
ncbi:Oidioi.mRNA.OKI2018_I69.PAR.g9507.t1.cds [Oikopleura dioica]|uniref:Oidioi.mRNA.OKI2018_I69.PAR.g9507.t1.cds n=1 Tax=Oikopleura dioica TaxID=34765 RepID=A0ABN7RKY6_OIKDI|nr:Oidioi.mRNA.OKI2018_I69.PAR.g9507.t1.cds [Oikopleura dioica]